jgi:hypothetical protein
MKWKESNINTRVHRGFTWLTQYNTFGILKQNEATKRCPNAPQSVNCQGKQHHANQFSQLQIKASELNYASKTFVDCLIKRNKIQKRLSLVSPPRHHYSPGFDPRLCHSQPMRRTIGPASSRLGRPGFPCAIATHWCGWLPG